MACLVLSYRVTLTAGDLSLAVGPVLAPPALLMDGQSPWT